MSEHMFGRFDDSTRDLTGGWTFGEVPPLDDDEPIVDRPPSRPLSGPAQTSAADETWTPPPGQPALPRPIPAPGSDPFRDFRLDSGTEPLSLSIQSLLRPNVRPVSDPCNPGPVATGGPASSLCPPPTPATAALKGSVTPDPQRGSYVPRVGDVLGGFRLVGELGRGAFARVFLAEQMNLAHRKVALKVSQAEGDEPLLLARLQHTHIVPIHSVQDDPATGLRLLCMPYLGGANLAQVLEAAGGRTAPAVHRRSLVDALDEVSLRMLARTGRQPSPDLVPDGAGSRAASRRSQPLSNGRSACLPRHPGTTDGARPPRPSAALHADSGSLRESLGRFWSRLRWRTPTAPAAASLDERDFDQPARQFLRQANSIQGSVWIIARLAEGLEHAHGRGLLHRDLKPSNILIAADGTPMLLDFNLSTDSAPGDPAEGEKAMLGGTLPYMAPEHLDAFHPEVQGPPDAVDERSDVYALGLILFEMIAGEHPFPEPPPGTPLLDVIRKLSRARRTVPSLRRANPDVPWSLDAIARKCLDPDPNRRYARARDLAEDLAFFLDDQPLKHAPEPSVRERLAKWIRRHPRVCHIVPVASAAAVMIAILAGIVSLLVDHTLTLNAHRRLRSFEAGFAESRFLLNLGSGPAEHLERGVALARQAINGLELSRSGEPTPDSWVTRLIDAEQLELRRDAAELILLLARARVRLAERSRSEPARREALEAALGWLDRAERLDPQPTAALYAERARVLNALGRADQAATDRARGAERLPTTARDYAMIGTARLAQGDAVGAEADLLRALDRDPRAFWAWFALGHSRFEQGRYLDAAGDFNACIALEPSFAWPHLNRGLALARAGRLEEARRAEERAVQLNDRFAEAWINLAHVDLQLNDLDAAASALAKAMALGRDDVSVLAALAEVKARQGDLTGSAELFDRLLRARPDDASLLTARGISRLRSHPMAARSDLERALQLDPSQARAHYGLALLLRQSDPPAALAHAEYALAADPNLGDALQLRALLRARQGQLGALDDVDELVRRPTPHALYNAACVLAILSQTTSQPRLAERSAGLVERAIMGGFPADRAASDPDLASVRSLPAFQKALTSALGRPTR